MPALTTVLDAVRSIPPAGYLALVVAVSVLCQWVAWRVRVPSILLLLLVGFGLGQLVRAEAVFGHDVLFGGVRLAVGVILFEGSLSLRFRQVTDLRTPVRRLVSVTVLIAWVLITLAAWALGFDPRLALLVGAILVVTGPTVINPILQTLRPTRRVSSLLRWEGIIVDPIGAVLALLVFQAILAGEASQAVPAVLLSLGRTLLVSFGIAIVLGAALEFLMRRHAVPDFLHGVVFLAAAVGALAVSDALQPESGLLTVTLLGIYLANRPLVQLQHAAEFTAHLQVLFVGTLFIVLAGRVTPEQVVAVLPTALLFLAALVLVVRPVSVLLGLRGTNVTRKERTVLACMAPRGVVAAAVTSIFALGLADAAQGAGGAGDLTGLADQATRLVPTVFVIIVCTVALYGLAIGPLAERLGLASANPQGVLFVGVNTWVVQTAKLLRELGIHTLIVARNAGTLAEARSAGLETLTANILSEFAVKDMDLAGIGHFVACTPEDEVNATAAREFARVFGGANTYQLHRDARMTGTGDEKHDTAGHLSARYAFVPALSRAELDRRTLSGLAVRQFELTDDYTLEDFRREHGEQAVELFVQRRPGTIEVAHEDNRNLNGGGTLIALAPRSAPLSS